MTPHGAGVSRSGDRVKRKGKRPTQRQGEVRTAQQPGAVSLLPMEIQIGDRFTDHDFEWEVVTHPSAFQGGKSLRARIRRPGLPETEREMTWPAHLAVQIRRQA
jgi:hypothetical protein